MKYFSVITLSLIFAGCKGPVASEAPPSTQSTSSAATENTSVSSVRHSKPISLRKYMACLPKEAAIVAGHRGTSKKEDLPENSRLSLQALIDHGILVAEVDVVGLKDGTHVLFHDGVWEDKTTGSGAVAATTYEEAEKFLLKDTDGDLSADRLISLSDALDLAKDRLFLEIDFKSSAKYDHVIKTIRSKDMEDQVILISYNDRQAEKLARLAPEMMLSVGASSIAEIVRLENKGVKLENMAIWMGSGPYEPSFITYLDNANIPILAWPKEGARKSALGPAAIAVTDYALQKKPIEGLGRGGKAALEACISE